MESEAQEFATVEVAALLRRWPCWLVATRCLSVLEPSPSFEHQTVQIRLSRRAMGFLIQHYCQQERLVVED